MKKIFSQNLFFISIILIYAILLSTSFLFSKSFFQANDLPGAVSDYIYIKESLLTFHTFPQWDFFIGTGIPIVNDPLTRFYNPLVFIPVLIFPFVFAIKTVYFLCILLSGIFFLILSRYLKIEKLFGLLLSLTFMSSGFLIARIVGGHFEWVLAYPLIPLFYLFLLILLDKKNIFWTGILSLIISLFIFSGNIYVGFYSLMILLLIIFFIIFKLFSEEIILKDLIKQIFYLMLCFVFFLLFSALKVIPVLELFQSTTNRSFDPFLGSQNIFSIVYNFFLPSQALFKYLNLDSFLSTPYYWWESFAYIGPFFVVGILFFFIFWRNIKKTTSLNLFMYLAIIFLLFSMLGSPLSPFHWLFLKLPILSVFRAPSRIFIFLIPLVLIFSYFGIEQIYQINKTKILKTIIILLMIMNLISVYYIFSSSYTKGFPPVNVNYGSLLDYLKQNDKSYYYIAQSVFFQNQVPFYETIENHQKLFDPLHHGWDIKGSPGENYFSLDFNGSGVYHDIYPKYFIYPEGYSPPKIFNAKIIRTIGDAFLYKSPLYTPYAYLAKNANEIRLSDKDDVNVESIKIEVDRIDIKAYSPNNNSKLIVSESYSSGWTSTIDGKKATILNERFLTVNAKNGLHEYSFVFSSITFKLGLVISFLSILAWILISYIYFYKYRNTKKYL